MRRNLISLSEKEKEQSRNWRLKKCGYDCFEILTGKFEEGFRMDINLDKIEDKSIALGFNSKEDLERFIAEIRVRHNLSE